MGELVFGQLDVTLRGPNNEIVARVAASAVNANTPFLPIAGSDGAALRALSTNASGEFFVRVQNALLAVALVSEGTPGAAAPAKAMQVGGSDGVDLRTIRTNAAGEIFVQIQNASLAVTTTLQSEGIDGAAPPAKTMVVAGSDGALAQTLRTNALGELLVQIQNALLAVTAVLQSEGTPGAAAPAKALQIGGTDATNLRSQLMTFQGANYQETLFIAAVRGQIPGAVVSGIIGEITTSATTNVPIRKTTYNEQSVNAQRSISSNNANDTAAGTGARTVLVTYFPADLSLRKTELITLNGVTPVNFVNTDVCFIEEMKVVSVGSGGANAGVITMFLAAAGAGGTFCTMAVGDNRTYWAHHYVASGRFSYFQAFVISLESNATNSSFITLRLGTPTVANSVDQVITPRLEVTHPGSSVQITSPDRFVIPGPSRLVAWAQPNSAAAAVTSFGGRYMDLSS